MDSIRSRAKEHFPSVLLTLLSIIQALALEVAWSTSTSTDYLWVRGLDAWIGWLQVCVTFLGIILVWLVYISIVMRISWVPTFRDSVIPFVIGLGEFLLAWMIAPELRAYWMIVLASIFGICSGASASIFVRASFEPENEALYRHFESMGTRSGRSAAIFVGTLLVLAGVLAIAGSSGKIALCVMALAIVLIVVQTQIIRAFWHESIRPD